MSKNNIKQLQHDISVQLFDYIKPHYKKLMEYYNSPFLSSIKTTERLNTLVKVTWAPDISMMADEPRIVVDTDVKFTYSEHVIHVVCRVNPTFWKSFLSGYYLFMNGIADFLWSKLILFDDSIKIEPLQTYILSMNNRWGNKQHIDYITSSYYTRRDYNDPENRGSGWFFW